MHNSLAIVENIAVELGSGVCREVFYNIICPFYAFLYTQRGGRRCAQQPGHCGEHCGVPASSMQRRGTGRPSGLAGQEAEGEGPLRRQQAVCE